MNTIQDYLIKTKLNNVNNPTCRKWGYNELQMKYNNVVINANDDNYFMTREQIQKQGLTNVDGGEPEYLGNGVWVTESVKLQDFAISIELLREAILKAIMLLQWLHNHYLSMDMDYLKWLTIKLYDIHQSLFPSKEANDISYFQNYFWDYGGKRVKLDILNVVVGLTENERNSLLVKYKALEAIIFDPQKTITINGIEYIQDFISKILSMAADYCVITVFADFDEDNYTIEDDNNFQCACLLYTIGFHLKGDSVEEACKKTYEHLDSNITPMDWYEIEEACLDMVIP